MFFVLLCETETRRNNKMENELPSDLSIWDERCMKIFIETNSALFRVFASRYVKDIALLSTKNGQG